jgi:sulfur carrier protein
MIFIEFNGEPSEIEEGTSISDLLECAKVSPKFCAVELNLEIVPKSEYEVVELLNGDKVEVVTLVGGG